MIKTDAGGKTKIICDRCGYTMEFPTLMGAWIYLGGRGRIYGWRKYCGYGKENILYCPVCSKEFEWYDFGVYARNKEYEVIEEFQKICPVEQSFDDKRDVIQMRLEMFQY